MTSTELPLIVCFGDSLTAGFQSPAPDRPDFLETPYGKFLAERLRDRARVQVSGVCGELTRDMVGRFERDVLRHKPAWTVILGGTNDLGWDLRPSEIMRHLAAMYEQATAAGIHVAGVTVPSIRGFDDHIPRRLELNRLIADYCAGKRFPCVDLFTATVESGSQRLAAPYSNDGLHLTTAGYELLAKLLYEQVFANRFVPATGCP
jgi:acyl-CoA thioesterase I